MEVIVRLHGGEIDFIRSTVCFDGGKKTTLPKERLLMFIQLLESDGMTTKQLRVGKVGPLVTGVYDTRSTSQMLYKVLHEIGDENGERVGRTNPAVYKIRKKERK